jgi:hypothetical protein
VFEIMIFRERDYEDDDGEKCRGGFSAGKALSTEFVATRADRTELIAGPAFTLPADVRRIAAARPGGTSALTSPTGVV